MEKEKNKKKVYIVVVNGFNRDPDRIYGIQVNSFPETRYYYEEDKIKKMLSKYIKMGRELVYLTRKKTANYEWFEEKFGVTLTHSNYPKRFRKDTVIIARRVKNDFGMIIEKHYIVKEYTKDEFVDLFRH